MYVYFGSEHYDRELFKNDKNLNIPKFSLIGFSLKSKNGWRKWRDDNDMNSVSKYDYFCFRINNNNLALENIDDIKKLPHYTNKGIYSIDYEALLKMDYPIYALHMKSKVAKYLLGIEYDCALVLSDVCLIENYSAKGTDNPIIFNNICPLKYNKGLFGEKEIGRGVFNGEIGTILKVDEKEKQIEIKFDDEKIAKYEFSDLDQIEHSYAITIHKAQRK